MRTPNTIALFRTALLLGVAAALPACGGSGGGAPAPVATLAVAGEPKVTAVDSMTGVATEPTIIDLQTAALRLPAP